MTIYARLQAHIHKASLVCSLQLSLAAPAPLPAAAAEIEELAAAAAQRPCRGRGARSPARARCVAGASCHTEACRPRTCAQGITNRERTRRHGALSARKVQRGSAALRRGCALVLVVLALGVRSPPTATQRGRGARNGDGTSSERPRKNEQDARTHGRSAAAARARRAPRAREAKHRRECGVAGDALAQRILERRFFLARRALAVYRAHHRVGHRHRRRHVRGRRRRSCAGATGRCHVAESCLAPREAAALSATRRVGTE